jgi:hypothetical protein
MTLIGETAGGRDFSDWEIGLEQQFPCSLDAALQQPLVWRDPRRGSESPGEVTGRKAAFRS